jgi:hypothetical protein
LADPLVSVFVTVTDTSPPAPAVTSSGAAKVEGGVNDNVPLVAASATVPVQDKPNVSKATADEAARRRRDQRGRRKRVEFTEGSDQDGAPGRPVDLDSNIATTCPFR